MPLRGDARGGCCRDPLYEGAPRRPLPTCAEHVCAGRLQTLAGSAIVVVSSATLQYLQHFSRPMMLPPAEQITGVRVKKGVTRVSYTIDGMTAPAAGSEGAD